MQDGEEEEAVSELGAGGLWGWGCYKMLPSISVCLNVEGQGARAAGWVCVYCQGALWEP